MNIFAVKYYGVDRVCILAPRFTSRRAAHVCAVRMGMGPYSFEIVEV